MLTIDEKGAVQTLGNYTKRLEKAGKVATQRAVFLTMNYMETQAKKNINKAIYQSPAGKYTRSGKAQQSIIGQMLSTNSARVYMGVNYGKYLEEGTGVYNGRKPYFTTFGGLLPNPIFYKGMKPRPFWVPSVKETKKEIPKIFEKVIKEI
jgi:HK97 gp10 family phage protein